MVRGIPRSKQPEWLTMLWLESKESIPWAVFSWSGENEALSSTVATVFFLRGPRGMGQIPIIFQSHLPDRGGVLWAHVKGI